MTWNDLTVEQYQILAPIMQRDDLSNIDKLVELISVCEGHPIDVIDSWPYGKLTDKAKEYEFLTELNFEKKAKKYIDCNGKRYKFVYEIQKMPAARYIETKHFGKDVTGNLHRIMACCVQPMKKTLWGWQTIPYDARNHEQYAEDIKKASFVDVWSCVVFFCEVFKNLIYNSQDYLVKQLSEVMTESQAQLLLLSFSEIMDGYTMPSKSQSMSASA